MERSGGDLPSAAEQGRFMRLALEQAGLALRCGEVPVGCVVVFENRCVSLALCKCIDWCAKQAEGRAAGG